MNQPCLAPIPRFQPLIIGVLLFCKDFKHTHPVMLHADEKETEKVTKKIGQDV